jgi:phage shock protein E
MITKIKKIFGIGPKADYANLVKQGAVIIDVRSKNEYAGGHIAGSVNIPLALLPTHLNKLKDKNQPIITCCASGMRSASAKNYLKKNGYKVVYNGGGWGSLDSKLK